MAEVTKVGPEAFTYSNGLLETVSSGTFTDVLPVRNGQISVSGNQCTFAGSRTASLYPGGSGWTAEQWAQVTLADVDGSVSTGVGGVIVRASGEDAAAEFYAAYYRRDGPSVQVYKFESDAFTQVGSDISTTFADGDILKLYAETNGANTDLTVYKNGSSVGVRTDTPTSIAGGSSDRTGIIVGNDALVDDFSGGILSAGGGTEALTTSASTGGQTAPSVNTSVEL
jgi:hypothetical protein